ncbi:MAG: electron transporter RnfC, partial [Dysgonamonadaceae bacterium]|nr:electron transporter RnfC [Dysgonamonadaceae bacterium]
MLKTFRIGSVHPEANKLSAGKAIQNIEIPSEVSIPLAQHIGVPGKPMVKRGDKVKVGTLIGKSAGFVSANIHSSVSGTVKKIDKVVDAS